MHTQAPTNTKLYRKHVPILWWTKRWVDIRFITRELTSVFVAGYAIVLLFYLRAISAGPEALASFSAAVTSPVVIFLHAFALLALVYHSVTWFNLAPKAMVIKVGGFTVPGVLIVLMNYGAWAVLSIAIIWLIKQSTAS